MFIYQRCRTVYFHKDVGNKIRNEHCIRHFYLILLCVRQQFDQLQRWLIYDVAVLLLYCSNLLDSLKYNHLKCTDKPKNWKKKILIFSNLLTSEEKNLIVHICQSNVHVSKNAWKKKFPSCFPKFIF